jgi:ATP-binding cassette subfamily F protein 3
MRHAVAMLHIDDISYAVAGKPLIDHASVAIPDGHKVGIVGRNGTGKTTLFRLIRGELALESGSITMPERARIGGVAQEVPGNEVSLIDTVLNYDTERTELMFESETATDGARIAEVQTRLADIDAWSAEARAASILKGLGFDDDQQRMPCSAFSGGWRMRVALAGVLFAQPDLLLLDEPTNYLDLEGALWLESYLARYPHTVLIVSHDRGLLNRAVGAILHLEDRKLTLYQGNYDRFADTRAARLASAESEAKKQEQRRAHLQSYVDRFRAKADKARQAQSRIKALARMKPISRPQEAALKRFSFPPPEELSPPILRIETGSVGYGGVPVLRNLNLRIDQDDRIALLGRNGEGKSTLSKLFAGKLDLIDGQTHKASKLRAGYFAQHQVEELHPDETPLEHIRRLRPTETPSRLRARLGGFGIGSEQADTTIADLSGGQKARLSLMLATLDAPHMLILDEPTNHLDIESRESLVEALTVYTGAIILVSHDMHLLSLVADRLWLVNKGSVTPYEGDLESYRTMLLRGDDAEKPARKPKVEKPRRPSRDAILQLRQDVKKCEQRVEKLSDMESKVASKLADPTIYNDVHGVTEWQKKYAEIKDGLALAEKLWLEAQEKLDAAER